jgi:ATP-dependent Clp protease ATP-binding subunit ClpB
MNAQKYTQKSMEAVQAAQQLTIQNENQQIEQIHLLGALMQQENGLIPQLLEKMGVSKESFNAAVNQELAKLPRVTGSGREADKFYVSRAVDNCLNESEKIAESMKDDYVSVEHLFLALLETADPTLKELFKTYNITKEREDTYEALTKYGTDLVKQAREQKLDPVIGRDDEIRNVIRILSPQNQEQPRADRRAGRRQDGHRRGARAAHCARRRARRASRTARCSASTWAR